MYTKKPKPKRKTCLRISQMPNEENWRDLQKKLIRKLA